MTIYNFDYKTPEGNVIAMNTYRGKVLLVINTATKCGLSSQFESLERLYKKYQSKGFSILGMPCNQFLNQEPETNTTMKKTCQLNYGVSFPLSEKIKVNGKNTHPLFVFLKKELGGFGGSFIKWNFTKFLINPSGIPYKRYSPATKPIRIERDIINMLGKGKD